MRTAVLITRVVHRREPHDVYIGRPSILGNPFPITAYDKRATVIAKYEHYARERAKRDVKFRAAIVACHGKVLGCYCAPLACHGDVIVRLAIEFMQEAA